MLKKICIYSHKHLTILGGLYPEIKYYDLSYFVCMWMVSFRPCLQLLLEIICVTCYHDIIIIIIIIIIIY